MTPIEYILLGLFLAPFVLFYSMFMVGLAYSLYYIFSKYTNLFDNERKIK